MKEKQEEEEEVESWKEEREIDRWMVEFQEVRCIDSGGLGVFQGTMKILLWHRVIITGVGLREWEPHGVGPGLARSWFLVGLWSLGPGFAFCFVALGQLGPCGPPHTPQAVCLEQTIVVAEPKPVRYSIDKFTLAT